MYRSFYIKNFRCFREFTFPQIERVNLIAGKNNVGKTALLEAIFLHLGPDNPELSVRINVWRGVGGFELQSLELSETFGSLFYNIDISSKIEISSIDDENNRRILSISLPESAVTRLAISDQESHSSVAKTNGGAMATSVSTRELQLEYNDEKKQSNIVRARLVADNKSIGFVVDRERLLKHPPGFFVSTRLKAPQEDAERFSKLEEIGRSDLVVDILRLLEPRLTRLAVLVKGSSSIIYGDIGVGRLLPLPLMGEGMVRLLTIVLAISFARKSVVIIDEIENGLHYSVMRNIWKAIAEAARQFDTQIFATTHSSECIQAAHDAFSEMSSYDFRLHRLTRIEDDIQAVSYKQEILNTALSTDLEVR